VTAGENFMPFRHVSDEPRGAGKTSPISGVCIVFINRETNIHCNAYFCKFKKRRFLQISPEECDHPVVGVLSKGLTDEAAVSNHESVRFTLVNPELEVLVRGIELH